MLSSLHTRDFRNLADGEWRPNPRRHLVLGSNGAGKTSLLEATYLGATTRSFRTTQLLDCVRHGSEGFSLRLEAGSGGREILEIGWRPGERLRRVGGQEVPLVEHLAVQPVVLWTAEHRDLLGGPPQLRRRLLDRGIVSLRPAAVATLQRYRRALAEKRQLLASGRGTGALESWNRVLAEAAAELVAMRSDYVARLEAAIAEVAARSPLDLPRPALVYRPSPRRALEGLAPLLAALAEVAAREREGRRPLVGPHRDELRFMWNEGDLARMASAGEAKAIGLLLVAAQGHVLEEAGRAPVYLLDDVDSELDRRRLGHAWSLLPEGAQVLATSSRPEVWEGLEVEDVTRLAAGERR